MPREEKLRGPWRGTRDRSDRCHDERHGIPLPRYEFRWSEEVVKIPIANRRSFHDAEDLRMKDCGITTYRSPERMCIGERLFKVPSGGLRIVRPVKLTPRIKLATRGSCLRKEMEKFMLKKDVAGELHCTRVGNA